MKKKVIFGSLGALALSSFAFAAPTINTALTNIQNIVNTATRIVYLFAFLAFFWFLANYIFNAGNDEKRKKATHGMIMSIIAIFVMTSIWGIVKLLQGTLGATDNKAIQVEVPGLEIR